jgi:hypothetical protein
MSEMIQRESTKAAELRDLEIEGVRAVEAALAPYDEFTQAHILACYSTEINIRAMAKSWAKDPDGFAETLAFEAEGRGASLSPPGDVANPQSASESPSETVSPALADEIRQSIHAGNVTRTPRKEVADGEISDSPTHH